MVKYNTLPNKKKSRIPLRFVIFWYRKIKNFITEQKKKNANLNNCTFYFSPKYPKMNILSLYKRIRKHLIKYLPNQSFVNKNQKINISSNKIIKSFNDKNNMRISEDLIFDKADKISRKIKHLNMKNCSNIIHLFNQPKFDEKFATKYDNNYVSSIIIRNNNNSVKIQKVIQNSLNSDISSNGKENISNNTNNFSKSSSLSLAIEKNKKDDASKNKTLNKPQTQFVTHFGKSSDHSIKSKYFIDDDYYNRILKSIGNCNSN